MDMNNIKTIHKKKNNIRIYAFGLEIVFRILSLGKLKELHELVVYMKSRNLGEVYCGIDVLIRNRRTTF